MRIIANAFKFKYDQSTYLSRDLMDFYLFLFFSLHFLINYIYPVTLSVVCKPLFIIFGGRMGLLIHKLEMILQYELQ